MSESYDSGDQPTSRPPMLAAVDLGSNSFRMAVARLVGDELRLVDRLREGVRLAAYLDERKRLNASGRQRALACLARFGQRVRDLPAGAVRAVGTNTLRQARNTARLLHAGEEALGHPIEVISGQEEARLIFLGAGHSLAGGPERRLVVDIGGGSTECILGDGFEPLRAESLYMGCVGLTLRHFADGVVDADRMRAAETTARLELRHLKKDYRRLGWDRCVGTSGTVHAVAGILRQNGWSDLGITAAGLRKLRKALIAAGDVEHIDLPGLKAERARVLPGGLAILSAVFDSLRVERMMTASGALREGVLYDLLGRLRHEDVRDRTIQRFVEQYRVDVEQARRVERTAMALLGHVTMSWSFDHDRASHFLARAARLHEIGLAVAHGGHHKHAAYLVANSDMPGFSVRDQQVVSLLVRGHRRKFPPASLFAPLGRKTERRMARRLCVLLRLAVLLNRSRSRQPLPRFELVARRNRLRLELPGDWLDEHRMTRADLAQEAGYLKAPGFELEVG